ncbi:MAG TPA: DMT family transporter [Rhabdochlamydiaceae bacterium]|nr:DMT family transporter [Rhabdochlamydiaceae bacterium]
MHKQDLRAGVIAGTLAAIFFTLMSLCVKLINGQASTATILLFRFGVSLFLLLPFVAKEAETIFKVDNPFKFVLRTVFALLALGCFFYSLNYISFTNALVLINTAPLFVPIFSWWILNAKTHAVVWTGIVIGFLGILFILRPDTGVLKISSIIGLGSGIFASLGIVFIRILSKVGSITQILFYNFVFATLISGIVAIFTWEPLDQYTIFLLIAAGVNGALYQYFSTLSYAKTPIRISSSLMFLCILFGALVEWFIWKKMPSAIDIAGMALVVFGGMWVVYFGQKHVKIS